MDFLRSMDLASLLFNVIGRRTVLILEKLSFSAPSVAALGVSCSESLTRLQGCRGKVQVRKKKGARCILAHVPTIGLSVFFGVLTLLKLLLLFWRNLHIFQSFRGYVSKKTFPTKCAIKLRVVPLLQYKQNTAYLIHSCFLIFVEGAVYSSVLQQASENEHKARDDVYIKSSGVWYIWSSASSVKEVAHSKNGYHSQRHTSWGRVGIDPEWDPAKKDNQGNGKIEAVHIKHEASFEDECGLWLRENTFNEQ